MKTDNYNKAKDYLFKRISELSEPETAKEDICCALNDAANIYAESRKEYQEIYDALNNILFS